MFLARFDQNHNFISEDKSYSPYNDRLYRIDEVVGSVALKMYDKSAYLLISSSIDRLKSKKFFYRMKIHLQILKFTDNKISQVTFFELKGF